MPPELDAAIRLCLERRPGDRYRSALELAQALEAGLRGESTNATRVLVTDEPTSSTRALPRTAYAPPPEAPEPANAGHTRAPSGSPRPPRGRADGAT